MSETTARHGLPLIQPGQAQKELAHNEALALLDLIAQPSVVAVGTNTPPGSPVPGQCWVVGASPSGAWSGHAHALAGWTGGGWRFASPVPGMTVWTGGAGSFARWSGSAWEVGVLTGTSLKVGGQQVVGARGPAIAGPIAGGTIDSESRSAIEGILAALRTHGLITG